MRLTLRTLLAYLDDTLEPAEAKALGAKLAESEPAQEVVERIRSVVARRRLTVPPASSRIDPNTVAEYLDNEVTPEQAEELERICLASDVHLAEVAACHQILSLVLDELPDVPEGATRRAYEIGKGLKVEPPRRAPRPPTYGNGRTTAESPEEVRMRMGLPPLGEKDWGARLMVGAGGIVAAGLLVFAISRLVRPASSVDRPNVPEPAPGPRIADLTPKPPLVIPAPPKPIAVGPPPEPVVETLPFPTLVKDNATEEPPLGFEVIAVPPQKVDPSAVVEPEPAPMVDALAVRLANLPYAPASEVVAPLGSFTDLVKDAVLLARVPKSAEWKRVTGKAGEIYATRTYAALPGSLATLGLGKGVKLTLWGNLPELSPAPPTFESIVTLHAPKAGVDVDLTLRRGRVVIQSDKEDGPAIVRVRFENPNDIEAAETQWLVALEGRGAEAAIVRWGEFPRDEPFYANSSHPTRMGPAMRLEVTAFAGRVVVQAGTRTESLAPAPETCRLTWNSRWPQPVTESLAQPPSWRAGPAKLPAEATKARQEASAAFAGRGADVALAELLRSPDPAAARLAVRALATLDDVAGLLEIASNDRPDRRQTARDALAHWAAAGRFNDAIVFDAVKARFDPKEAAEVVQLLEGVPAKAAVLPATYATLIQQLGHEHLLVRELAAANLYRLAPIGASIAYDATDAARRDAAQRQWRTLIPAGKLPPTPKKTK